MGALGSFVAPFLKLIAVTSRADGGLLAEHARLPWLQVMDGLIRLARCEPSLGNGHENLETYLALWRRFGEDIQIDENDLRAQIASNRKIKINGCSWLRCPLFGAVAAVSERDPLLCPTCRKVGPTWIHFLVVTH